MEVVHAFNNELSSLYDVKPPISKAKMTQITKSAIKGIKLYKHIVQSVEKFIQKCRPEYKVPGLYVVDSIVRQSRHQFGADRDVFAPRFARNINVTFQHLFKCPEEERPKIVRVLNLWQKNQVFPIELIQPLLNMAVPTPQQSSQPVMTHSPPEPPKSYQDTSWGSWGPETASNHGNAACTTPSASIDPQILLQIQQHLQAAAAVNSVDSSTPNADAVKFDKKLLDFDYGDDEEEEEQVKQPQAIETNALALSMAQNLLNNPDLLRQLQQMNFQQPLAVVQEPPPPMAMPPSPDKSSGGGYPGDAMKIDLAYNTSVPPPYMPGPPPDDGSYPPMRNDIQPPPYGLPPDEVMEEPPPPQAYAVQQDFPPQDLDERILPQVVSQDSQDRDKSSAERERSRSPRGSRRNSRRHRSRSPRFKRGRSRSRSRRRGHSRSRSRERERKHRGLMPLKKNCLSVYSTTLWLGHLSKLASEADLSDAFGEFGTILSIDMIPPRGCAFICMSRRQDALRALQKLKNLKLHGSVIKMAWAPGKGVKEKEYRDYWDVDTGVSHIPYDKLNKDTLDLDALEEGGMVDEESAPEFIQEMLKKKRDTSKTGGAVPQEVSQQPVQQPVATTEAPATPMITPSVPPPVVPSHIPMLTMPPFGMHVPGMMHPSQHMVIPMGVPPPNPMMMVGAMLPPPPYMPPTTALSPESSHTEDTQLVNPPPYLPTPMEYPPSEPVGQDSAQTTYPTYAEPEHVEPPKPKSRALLPDPILDQNGLPIVPQQGGPPRDNYPPLRDNFRGGFNHREGFPPRGDFHRRNRDFHPPPMDGFPPPQDNFYPRDNFGPPPPRGRGFGPPRGGGFFPPPPPFHRDREFHPRGFPPRGMRGGPRGRGFFPRGGFRGRRGGSWDMWGGPPDSQEWEDEDFPPEQDQEMEMEAAATEEPVQENEAPPMTEELHPEPEPANLPPKEEEPKEFIPKNPRRKSTRWNMDTQPVTDLPEPCAVTNGPSAPVMDEAPPSTEHQPEAAAADEPTSCT